MKAGFTLVECCLYLVLSSLLSFLLFKWWIECHEQLIGLQWKMTQSVQASSLMHLLSTDIAQADPDLNSWQSASNRFSFAVQGTIISYYISKKMLKRSAKTGLQRAKKATIAQRIDSINVHIGKNMHGAQSIEVDCRFDKGKKYLWHFPLRRGLR